MSSVSVEQAAVLRQQIFLEVSGRNARFTEPVVWTPLLQNEIRHQLLPTIAFDIDFVGITGRCDQLLEEDVVKNVLLNQAQGRIQAKCFLQPARFSNFNQALIFGCIGNNEFFI